jgi:hypothetical protein
MPDYLERSYIPFMKAAWKVQNQTKPMPQPHILVIDHPIPRTSSFSEH